MMVMLVRQADLGDTPQSYLDRQASLFDEQDHIEEVSKNIVTIDKQIKISIDQLDFRYGAIAFKYKESKLPIELEFEIENDEIRPEFDVLKPYFAKFLKSKNITTKLSLLLKTFLITSIKTMLYLKPLMPILVKESWQV